MKLIHQILRDATRFTGSHYIASLFDIFNNLFTRKILGPMAMGLFSELMLIYQFGKLHHLGLLNALDREIPLSHGQSETSKVQLIESVAFTSCLITSWIAGAIILLGSLFPLGWGNRIGCLLIALLVVTDNLVSYYRILLRTHNEFNTLSRLLIYASLVETIVTIIGVILWGVIGLLLAILVASLFGIFYVCRRNPRFLHIPLSINWNCLKSLFLIGIPLSLYGVIRTLFLTIDRILILTLLGRLELGFYSIAMMIYNFVTPLPRMVYNVIYPRFLQAFGKTPDLNQLKGYLFKPTLAFGTLYPLLAGVGVLSLPLLLHYFLPQFLPGLKPAQILLWGTCCYSVVFMWGYALIAIGKQWIMVLLTTLTVLLELILCYGFVKIGQLGLVGIALGTAMAHLLFSLFLMGCVLWRYQKRPNEFFSFIIKLYTPLVGAVGVVTLLEYLFPLQGSSLWHDLGHFFLQLSLFLLGWGTLMVYKLNREIQLFQILKEWK